jgi:hypothetical protein
MNENTKIIITILTNTNGGLNSLLVSFSQKDFSTPMILENETKEEL